jgi:hypothetical protein
MIKLLLIALFQAAPTSHAVQGVVVDATTGAPIAGACVSVYGAKPPITRTDNGGLFRLEVTEGTLSVTRPGYLPASNMPLQTAQDLTIRLTPQAVISGKAEDEDGFPVVDAMVSVMQYREISGERRLVPVRQGWSNDLGQYRIGGVAAGRYYLQITNGSARNWDGRYAAQFFGGTTQPSDEHMLEVKTGEQRAETNIRLLKFEGVTVSGRMEGLPRTSNGPMTTWVRLKNQDESLSSAFDYSMQPDGTFQTRHVTPGRYIVVAQNGSGTVKAGDLMAQVPVEVAATDVRDVVLTLRAVKAIDVAGKVAVDGGGAPGRTSISLRGNMGGGVTAHSEEDGSFVLKGLLPGHYDLQVVPDRLLNPQKFLLLPISARLGEKEVLRKGIDIDDQPMGPMNITLGRPIAIRGKLVDAAGQPVANQTIYFLSPAGPGTAASNAEGAFQTYLRVAGDYHVYALPEQNLASDSDYLKEHEKDFPVVRVVSGENPPILLRWMSR